MSNVNIIKSNHDIILREANQKGFNYTGDNLLSYAQWIKRGYVIIRGRRRSLWFISGIKVRTEEKY